MKPTSYLKAVLGRWALGASAACLLASNSALALDVIDPTGALYTSVSANSEYDHNSYGGQNMFDTDVTGVTVGTKLTGGDWARVGIDPGYLAFQLDASHTVGSVYYAQRSGFNAVLDKVTRLSVWASDTAPFTAADPGVPASTIVAVTESGGALWTEYLFTNNIVGRYFLVKIEQLPNVGGNIGGNELRLGLANLSAPPSVSQQPSSHNLYLGGTLRLSIKATGTAPLVYQWKYGATALQNDARTSGVDGADLVVQNITAADSGTYSCTVANSAGTAVSDSAVVSIMATPTGFGGAVISNNPVAYWRFDEAAGAGVAYEGINSFDGTYGVYSLVGVDGPKQADFPGFSAANTAVQITGFTTDSAVALPSLALYTNTVTIVAWINPQGAQQPYTGIVFNRNPGTTSGLIFSSDGTKLGYQWSGVHYNFDSGLVLPTEQWSLVAMSVTSSNVTLYLGTGDQLSSSVDTAAESSQYFTGTTYAGLDTDVGESGRTFNGFIDDVAVFNRALSPAEMQALFSAAVGNIQVTPVQFVTQPLPQNLTVGQTLTLTPVVVGTVPIHYQWFTASGAIPGATNLIYNVAAVSVADAANYYLVASNKAGAVTSDVVRVTVLGKPVQVLDPTGALYTGVSASSEYPSGGYEAVNLFNTDVSSLSLGDTVSGSGWAENGSDPAYVAFQLDKSYSVQAIYYAQRAGDNPTLDKVTTLSVWSSATAAFDPMSPPTTDPAATVAVTVSGGAIWTRYLFPDAISGQYFLVMAAQTPNSGGNIGGAELRLGVTVTPEKLQWSWTRAGLILTWTSGTLQVADSVTGPWAAATGIVSGSVVPASATQKYFRLKY